MGENSQISYIHMETHVHERDLSRGSKTGKMRHICYSVLWVTLGLHTEEGKSRS